MRERERESILSAIYCHTGHMVANYSFSLCVSSVLARSLSIDVTLHIVCICCPCAFVSPFIKFYLLHFNLKETSILTVVHCCVCVSVCFFVIRLFHAHKTTTTALQCLFCTLDFDGFLSFCVVLLRPFVIKRWQSHVLLFWLKCHKFCVHWKECAATMSSFNLHAVLGGGREEKKSLGVCSRCAQQQVELNGNGIN